jgi:hypothetical protein
MTHFVAEAVAAFYEESLNAEDVVLTEQPDGSGARIEIQRAISPDEDDHTYGSALYCLVNESGNSHYGGVRSWRVRDESARDRARRGGGRCAGHRRLRDRHRSQRALGGRAARMARELLSE